MSIYVPFDGAGYQDEAFVVFSDGIASGDIDAKSALPNCFQKSCRTFFFWLK